MPTKYKNDEERRDAERMQVRARVRARNDRLKQQRRARGLLRNVAEGQAEAPPHYVIAERDEALNKPRTLTSEAFGDPLPGRSALERRNA